MPKLIWSRAALGDVQRLYRFLSVKDPKAAARAAKAIRDDVRIIAKQPNIGRPVEGMDPEFREWIVRFGASGYVVMYRVDDDLAIILAVRHQREAGF
jgi:plasmid stabilization system protein ParE